MLGYALRGEASVPDTDAPTPDRSGAGVFFIGTGEISSDSEQLPVQGCWAGNGVIPP